MADALDAFVVDGIEHNIPFLAALMQHPRWREGRLSTGFIAEEFPEGFTPIVPDDGEKAVLAAIATAVELVRRERLDRLAGRLAPHSGVLKREWVVRLDGDYVPVSVVEGIGLDPDANSAFRSPAAPALAGHVRLAPGRSRLARLRSAAGRSRRR